MGILTRFKDIMSSNINALLDKAEDPAKMVDQYMRNLEKDFNQVKSETATVMAAETAAKRALDECDANIAKYQSHAKKAVDAGNDDLARKCLEKKNQFAAERESLEKAHTLAAENAKKMRQLHDKLRNDIQILDQKRATIKANVAVAKTQSRMNKMMNKGVSSAQGNLNAFSNLEARANQMLDKANAEAELNASYVDDDLDAQIAGLSSSSVDDELAALKGESAQAGGINLAKASDDDIDAELAALKAGQ